MQSIPIYNELNPFTVTEYNGWCVELTFVSTPLNAMAKHTIVNTGNNEKHARQIAENCNKVIQEAFKKGFDAGLTQR